MIAVHIIWAVVVVLVGGAALVLAWMWVSVQQQGVDAERFYVEELEERLEALERKDKARDAEISGEANELEKLAERVLVLEQRTDPNLVRRGR